MALGRNPQQLELFILGVLGLLQKASHGVEFGGQGDQIVLGLHQVGGVILHDGGIGGSIGILGPDLERENGDQKSQPQ